MTHTRDGAGIMLEWPGKQREDMRFVNVDFEMLTRISSEYFSVRPAHHNDYLLKSAITRLIMLVDKNLHMFAFNFLCTEQNIL